MPASHSLCVPAPAKINLDLHITARLDSGYHILDSLVAFADISDEIQLSPAVDFSFEIDGPFAAPLQSNSAENLVVKAAQELAKHTGQALNFHLKLIKNLPVSAGIGGGSSDAAAVIRALMKLWELKAKDIPTLQEMLLELGADVPACFYGAPVHMSGIGEILEPAPALPETHIILVNPLIPCPTAGVFRGLKGPSSEAPPPLPEFESFDHFIECLSRRRNDLQDAAMTIVPQISEILRALLDSRGCALARMSGSGATCFGLFKSAEDAAQAAHTLQNKTPAFWIRQGLLL